MKAKQLTSITKEVLSIQNDTSKWIDNIKDPRNKDFDLSTSLLLARCKNIINKIDELKEKINDSTILTILLQNRVIIENTKKRIEDLKTLIRLERQGINVSNETVNAMELISFKNKLLADSKRHGENKNEEV